MLDLTGVSYRTSKLKEISKELVSGENVKKNTIVGVLLYIPFIVMTFLLSSISILTGLNSDGIIYLTAIEIVMAAFTSLYYMQVGNIIKNKVAKIDFQVNTKLFLIMFIVLEVLTVIKILFLQGNVGVLIAEIISVIVAVIFLPVYYLIINRDYSIQNAVNVGVSLGFKYFFKILWLEITFIPWMLLIGITFGIVGIFKLTYIKTTLYLLVEKILQENNL
ncbi:DUF975 family protein [uncultured Clostridium sp.]|uniref:DUF975 family protein n=1 Tax=uncultured Clostridium sp. TaxID=59620 RepID=UPI00260CEE9C|nr:DUF975 family protein [uncultured Clostridium sp.]